MSGIDTLPPLREVIARRMAEVPLPADVPAADREEAPGILAPGVYHRLADTLPNAVWEESDASLADGLMDVCLIRPVGPVTGLRLLPRATRGERVEHERIEQIRCAELTFESREPVACHLDGEAGWLEPGRHDVRIKEEKLTLRVPRNWSPDV